MLFSILSLIIFSKEIKADCPPKSGVNPHDISLGDYSFQENEYIYGCHVNAKAINAEQCNLIIYACKFVELNSQTEKGGAIYLNITNYFTTVPGENKIQNCDFIKCTVYERNGSGGAIYFSSVSPYSIFTIEYCNFEYNSIYVTGYMQNSIYFAAAQGNIKYCTFLIQHALFESHGSAIVFSFDIDNVIKNQKLNVEHNNFTQNNCDKIYSLIEFNFQKTVFLNFNDNTININSNSHIHFRLFRSNVETTTSISSFTNNCLLVTNSISAIDIFGGFQYTKDDFVDQCTTEIPDRTEEPGEIPVESSSSEVEKVSETSSVDVESTDESGPIVLLDSSNCNKEKRCSRSPVDNEQVIVIVLVTNFTGYTQQNDDGGAIKITNCGLICNISSFTDCTSPNGVGGAIYFNNKLEYENDIILKGIVFTRCSAKCGGGIYVISLSNLGTVKLNHCKFLSNSATATESEKDQLKCGGSCIFLYGKKGEVVRCSFKNSEGVGGSFKIYTNPNTKSQMRLNVIQKVDEKLNFILVDECDFLNSKKSGSSLFYIGGNGETKVNVHNCVFKGKLNDKSLYIDGVLLDENAAKITVESCSFDCELKNSVDLNLVKIDLSPSPSLNSKHESCEIWLMISSVVLLAVVAVSIFVFIMVKLKRSKNNENSLELQEPLNDHA